MHEAILYQKLADEKARCAVCHHRCLIREGRRGLCAVRENRAGILYALNYGRTVAAGIDPIEKKPLYHFLPRSLVYSFAALGCNMACAWCQNWQISQDPKPDRPVAGQEISPGQHVAQAVKYGCPAIAYTYSEPTMFLEYALDTMQLARDKGLKNIWVTNGYMTGETLDSIIPYLDAANVDYKGPDDAVYQQYCGARAKPITENLKTLYRAGIHMEITTLIVPGVNDRSEQLQTIARFIAEELSPQVPWHISRFFPAWKMADTPVTPLASLELAQKLGQNAGLRHIHVGNV